MTNTKILLRIIRYFRKHDEIFLRKETWAFLWTYLKQRIYHLIPVILGLIVVSLSAFLNLWLINLLFEKYIPEGNVKGAIWLGTVFLVLRLAAGGAGIWLRIRLTDIIASLINNIRKDQMSSILTQGSETEVIDDIRRRQSVLVNETDRLQSALLNLIDQTFPALAMILALLILLAYINIWMLVLFMFMLPIIFILLRKSGGELYKRIVASNRADLGYQTHLSFVLQYLDHIRIRTAEKIEIERHSGLLDVVQEKYRESGLGFAVNQYVHTIIYSVIFILILIWGSAAVMNGNMSIGDLLILYITGNMLFVNLNVIVSGFSHFLTTAESLSLLSSLPKYRSFIGDSSSKRPNLSGKIEFRQIHFGYPTKQVINNLNFTIEPGSCVALMGRNGAGKTTIINLLLGFRKPTSGSILLDGTDLSEIDLTHYRSSVGFVPQKPRLFPDSIRNNLTYGRHEYKDQELFQALELAMAADLVNGMEKGLETSVGEDGVSLSGGERQRLAIASALLPHPRLLILDEPTNHLDANAIHQLIQNLAALPSRPTIILVSHKEEVISMADRILMLKDGSVTEINNRNF